MNSHGSTSFRLFDHPVKIGLVTRHHTVAAIGILGNHEELRSGIGNTDRWIFSRSLFIEDSSLDCQSVDEGIEENTGNCTPSLDL